MNQLDTKQIIPITLREQSDDLVVYEHVGTSGRLVVSFSGIGREEHLVPSIEFPKIATDDGHDSALFIIDPNRTWLNHPDLIERIVRHVEAFSKLVDAREIVTLGHSMGGYSALILPHYVPVKSAVAMSPQFSVHPDVAGDDQRWMIYRENITKHIIRSIADYWQDSTMYHIFHGEHGREAPQRNRFPVRHNLYHTILRKTVHGVPKRLKNFGLLEPVVQRCFENRPKQVRLILADKIGAYRRQLEQFPALAPSSEVSS